ncbi:hypothetical protein GCM10023068_27110 [Leifsonia shinshuensis]
MAQVAVDGEPEVHSPSIRHPRRRARRDAPDGVDSGDGRWAARELGTESGDAMRMRVARAVRTRPLTVRRAANAAWHGPRAAARSQALRGLGMERARRGVERRTAGRVATAAWIGAAVADREHNADSDA